MNKGNIGIIGGSGVYNIDGVELIKEHIVDTPFGNPSSSVKEMSLNGAKFFFIPRHGEHHTFLPHEVNYRANIFALKQLGVDYLISASAVGSLREDVAPGTLFFPDQFIDWTKGGRERTFFGKGVVAHVSTANPIEENLRKLLIKAAEKATVDFEKDGTYICIEGPQFSSKAESNLYRSFGASVIGMTNVPESYLAKEAGMAYATIAMVTDYDCWKEEHCTVDEIMKVMKENNISVHKVLKEALPELFNNRFDFVKENAIGVMTPLATLDSETKAWVETLLS